MDAEVLRVSRFKELDLELPAELSEAEKDAFKKKFEIITELMSSTFESILEMKREEAQRYYQLLIQGLQQIDTNFIAQVKPVAPKKEQNLQVPGTNEQDKKIIPPGNVVDSKVIKTFPDGRRLVRKKVRRDAGFEFRRKGGDDSEFVEIEVIEGPLVLPSHKPDFLAIFNQLSDEAQEKARGLLECVKDFFREDGPGIEVICNECSIEAIQECLRSADPGIDDILTHMIRAESER